MNRNESVIAARIYFLERELERLENVADDAESDLRANPTDASTRRQLEALYALAGDTWSDIQSLRTRLNGGPSLIYFDRRLADPRARALRQALV